tara:strand:- start:79 stop:393 length:315 start_codon:yes stop_codon:yes gene_type:complete
MDEDLKKLLEKERKDVRHSIYKMIIGAAMILTIDILTLFQIIEPILMVTTLPLCFILALEVKNFRIHKAVLTLMRYVLGDEETTKRINNLIKENKKRKQDESKN